MGLLWTNLHNHNFTVRPEINNQVDVTVEHPNKIGEDEKRIIKQYLFEQIDKNPEDYRKVAELLGITVLQLEVFIDSLGQKIIRHPETRVPLRPTLENFREYVFTPQEYTTSTYILRTLKDGQTWPIPHVFMNLYPEFNLRREPFEDEIVERFHYVIWCLEVAEEITYYSDGYIKKNEKN